MWSAHRTGVGAEGPAAGLSPATSKTGHGALGARTTQRPTAVIPVAYGVAMSAVRAATALALWGAAHAGAGASPDEVLAALAASGPTAGVRAADATTADSTGLPGPGEASANSLALLRLFRAGGVPRLMLPVPGDVRGLPPRSAALVPALDAGAAVVLPAGRLAVIPENGHWRVFGLSETPAPLPEPAGLLDVERDLDAAIRQATARLTTLDVARGGQNARSRIATLMRDAAIPMPRRHVEGTSARLRPARQGHLARGAAGCRRRPADGRGQPARDRGGRRRPAPADGGGSQRSAGRCRDRGRRVLWPGRGPLAAERPLRSEARD